MDSLASNVNLSRGPFSIHYELCEWRHYVSVFCILCPLYRDEPERTLLDALELPATTMRQHHAP